MSDWLDYNHSGSANGCNHDSRVVIPKAADPEILERADSGD